MYSAGKLIYFDPFHFTNGAPSKPKYFLVLKVIESNAVLVSLPSSVNHLPQLQPLTHGCLELPDSCINCYIIEPGKAITKSGWSFPLHTILYGNWLDDVEISLMEARYSIEGVDYEIIGEILDEELKKIIECFANSSSVKRKYKRILLS